MKRVQLHLPPTLIKSTQATMRLRHVPSLAEAVREALREWGAEKPAKPGTKET